MFLALNEDHTNFTRFHTVNSYKAMLPDRTISVPCILQFRCRL